MKRIILIIIPFLLFSAKQAFAVCPVCTVAVGAGLGLAEWLGIDDTISGLWIGGLTVSLILWTINWLKKRKAIVSTLKNPAFSPESAGDKRSNLGRNLIIFVGYYAIIIGPLWWKGIIGHPYNQICGMDKILFGIILGSALFAGSVVMHNFLRKRNEGKSHFPGQKIVFALIPLIIATVILYLSC